MIFSTRAKVKREDAFVFNERMINGALHRTLGNRTGDGECEAENDTLKTRR